MTISSLPRGFPCSWWNGACESKNLDLATCFMLTLGGNGGQKLTNIFVNWDSNYEL